MGLPLLHGLMIHSKARGRPLHYTDMAIIPALMMKRVFNLSLRALQGFVDPIIKLMGLPLYCPDYSLVSRRARTVNINIKTPARGEISHLVIDATGLKVSGEGNGKSCSMELTVEEYGAGFIWLQTVQRMRLSVPVYHSAERQMYRRYRV